jgi:hypothetical protein
MKTVAGVRAVARLAAAGFNFPMPDSPIRQAHAAGQQSAATQKITASFLRLLSLFAATVLFNAL